ncbi:glycosyltransferase [Isoalcanivorax beigongshangi]|uniref:Glycosyltransferase n=1 Tax=Isoalcanivorax beigongshangi TaxID=3238810 RepID=A0ABV4AFN4_9GAMM
MKANSKMKVVVVTSYPLIEPVVANRMIPFLNGFLEDGREVHYLCPSSDGKPVSFPHSVRVHEVALSLEKPAGFFGRALKEMKDAFKLLKTARKVDASVYLVTAPSMFLIFLSPLLLLKYKVVLDIRDLSWEYLSDQKVSQRFAKYLFRIIFERALGFFEVVSVTNDTEYKYVSRKMRQRRDVIQVSNGVSQLQFERLSKVEPSQNESMVVSYIGNVGLAQDLSTLVKVAALRPKIKFKIIGAGNDLHRVQELSKRLQLVNVEFVGRVPWEEVIYYYNQSDVLYAQLAPCFSGAMPSKLYEYLATGKHIIYGGGDQAQRILMEFSNYQLVEPCDPYKLVGALDAANKMKVASFISMKDREKVADKYIRENQVIKLRDALRAMEANL